MKIPKIDAAGRQQDPPSRALSRSEPVIDGSEVAFRQMVHHVMMLASRMQQARGRLAAYVGLSSQQFAMLVAIGQHQDHAGFGIIQVADLLGLSGAFVTIEMNKLVAAGLARKMPNATDRRRVLLTVTQRGRELLEQVNRVQRPSHDAIFADLSRDEFDTLRRVLPRLVESSANSVRLVDFLTSQ